MVKLPQVTPVALHGEVVLVMLDVYSDVAVDDEFVGGA